MVLPDGNIARSKKRLVFFHQVFPRLFWFEAVKTAEFPVNRYSSSLLDGKSPFFRWYGYDPLYSVLHPFGVQCRALIPPAKRTSVFSPVSSDAIVVGYSPAIKLTAVMLRL